MASPHITADMVEATEYMELARKYRVRGVPKTIINGVAGFDGAVPEAMIVEQVLRAAQPQAPIARA